MRNEYRTPPPTRIGGSEFRWGERTFVMGILNLTPDSFSGDGLGMDVPAALAQARRFVALGADIIDVGGESTRPGAAPVSEGEELARVIPTIKILAAELSVPISIDTCRAAVAEAALQAGATIVNDIWGLQRDPDLAGVAALYGAAVVLSSNQRDCPADDIIPAVLRSLQQSIDIAKSAGIAEDRIIVDPGIGFGKTLTQNLELVRCLARLRELGRPILLGTSRKSFIGLTLDLPADQRIEGTAASVAIGIAGGADIVRIHDVQYMVRVCRMSDAIVRGK